MAPPPSNIMKSKPFKAIVLVMAILGVSAVVVLGTRAPAGSETDDFDIIRLVSYHGKPINLTDEDLQILPAKLAAAIREASATGRSFALLTPNETALAFERLRSLQAEQGASEPNTFTYQGAILSMGHTQAQVRP